VRDRYLYDDDSVLDVSRPNETGGDVWNLEKSFAFDYLEKAPPDLVGLYPDITVGVNSDIIGRKRIIVKDLAIYGTLFAVYYAHWPS
jgi:hypothetical protein